jgi:hypothetical protein
MRRLIQLAGAIVVVIGVVLLIVGVVGLFQTVSVAGPNGDKISCGTAVSDDPSAAQQADNQNPANLPIINQFVPHTSYVAECESARAHQRSGSLPQTITGVVLAVIGVILVAGAFVIRGGTGRLGLAGRGGPPMSG